jgi:hypothetical protein
LKLRWLWLSWLEHWIVVPDVGGSSPLSHPINYNERRSFLERNGLLSLYSLFSLILHFLNDFLEFMLQVLKQALAKAITVEVSIAATHHVALQVTHQVRNLLKKITGEMTRGELMEALELNDRVNFRSKYLEPALIEELIEMTQPDSPKSPTQRYRLTAKGRNYLKMN